MAPQLIEPEPTAGFRFPYFLHVPETYDGERPILVEPTNTGYPSDDLTDHRETARKRAEGGTSRRIADRLDVPYLHPIFPRPAEEPVDWTHYTHALCARTMRIDDGPLERIDRQTLAMIDDARERIGGEPPRDVLLDGFSASGSFANRLTALHPDRVRATSAGGVNGMVTLPIRSVPTPERVGFAAELPASYPVGVADVADLTGRSFDAGGFRETPQFYYLGADDDHDSLLWPDAWTDPELRASAIMAYGPSVHEARFPTCRRTYEEHDVRAIFRTYPAGHEPTPAVEDVVAFHEHAIAGSLPSTETLGGSPVERGGDEP